MINNPFKPLPEGLPDPVPQHIAESQRVADSFRSSDTIREQVAFIQRLADDK